MNSKKYKLLLTLTIILVNSICYAQSGYVQQDNITVAGVTTSVQIYNLPISQRQTLRSYYDGLGRPIQTVAVQASVNNNDDIIQPVQYDNLGRQTTQYLPYVGADGSGNFHSSALTEQQSYYTAAYNDSAPYSTSIFDNSPLQRLLEAGTVGQGYQPNGTGTQHYKTVSYRNNISADNVIIFSATGIYTAGTYYAANLLSVTDGKDEDGVETLAFTDYLGRTILKRQLTGGANLDTYYIYNTGGKIAYVVTPKGSAAICASSSTLLFTSTPLSNLIFTYVYDTQGRLMQKKTPGAPVSYIIYDPLNRPVLVQDGNMRAGQNWYYIKYDVKGRPISQGIYNDVTHTTPAAMQTYVNGMATAYTATWYESRSGSSTNKYYTNSIFPTTGITPLAFSFFDDYDLYQTGGVAFNYSSQGLPNEETQTTAAVKGMPTMMLKRSVGSGLSNIWLMSAMFYDRRGHVIQTQTNNQLNYTTQENVTDTKTLVPDFAGRPQQALTVKETGTTNKVLTTFNYDAHMARLLSVSQQYNSQAAVTIAAYAYNELGQLTTKNMGNTSGSNYLQTLSYTYNIRGQLLTINSSQLTGTYSSSVFGMQLLYDVQDAGVLNTPYYSGRLSAVKWMTKDGNNVNGNERSYKYSYDNLDRLTASTYGERSSTTGSFSINADAFDENGITYDENGNIQTLTRNSIYNSAITQVDNLNYTYAASNPDSLINMTDGTATQYTAVGFRNLTGSTANYAYDANGNLTSDPYKGLTLAYNFLNKTDKITVNTATNRWIDYTYDGSGSVIRKRVYDNNNLQTTTDYIDGFVYTNSTLAYFPMPEGRVVNNSGTLTPEYIITDMQGNARISFNNTGIGGTAKVVQENSYSGFGLVLANSSVTGGSNKNLYNGGSEWQNDYSNLPDYYQTFYRNYDAATGRFISTDPEPESSESMTPYQYAGNNPVMMNDPLGNKKLPNQPLPMPPNGSSGGSQPISFQSNLNNGVGGSSGDPLDELGLWAAQNGSIEALNYYAYSQGAYNVYQKGSEGNTGDLSLYSTAIGTAYYDPINHDSKIGENGDDEGNIYTIWMLDPYKLLGTYANQGWEHLTSSDVRVTFDPGANQLVSPRLANYFAALMSSTHKDLGVNSVNISSTTNHPTNAARSRHTIGLAFDINYINGVHVSNNPNSSIYGIEFDLFPELLDVDRELNEQYLEYYSPVMQQRWVPNDGNTLWPSVAPQHQNHIHISLQ